jgi:GNAT superfamily N-acetyltransferase
MTFGEVELEEGEYPVAEMDVEHRSEFRSTRIGSVLVTNQRIIFLYQSAESWKKFATHQLSSEPFAQYRDGDLFSIFILESDAEPVSQLKSDYIEKVEDITGTTYFLDVLDGESQDPPLEPSECVCDHISSNRVLVESENVELDEYFDENEFRFVSCKSCYRIYGRYRDGRKASLDKLFSADWLLTGDLPPEAIVEFGEDDAFGIHHVPGASTRTQDTVLTLSHIAARSGDVVSTYKHEYQHALCYVLADEVTGYLTWEEHDRGPIMSQLYVREGHRGEGIATALVSGWYKYVCESEHYFADELTGGGKAVLESLGHLGDDSAPAQEVLSLTPMAFG